MLHFAYNVTYHAKSSKFCKTFKVCNISLNNLQHSIIWYLQHVIVHHSVTFHKINILHYLKVCFHPCNIENDLINFAEDCVLEPINELKGIDGKGDGGEEEEKQ